MEPAGGVRVVDLGSANGTFVDGRRVERGAAGGRRGDAWSAGVEIAVLARRPASEGGEAPPPSWSVVGRLVDSRTRGARRATWVALGAAALALVAVAVVLLVGGGGERRRGAGRGQAGRARDGAGRGAARRAADGDRLGLGARRPAGPRGDRGARRQRGRALPRGRRRPVAATRWSWAPRRARTSRCCRCSGPSGLESAQLGTGAGRRAGRDGGRARLPGRRHAERRGDLHPRRRLGHAHDVPRPGPGRPRLPRRGPDRHARSTRATPAARWSISTAA